MTDAELEAAYAAIDWSSVNYEAVAAYYAAIGRPPAEQVLLVHGPVHPSVLPAWRRRCLADLAAMQRRACPGCAA